VQLQDRTFHGATCRQFCNIKMNIWLTTSCSKKYNTLYCILVILFLSYILFTTITPRVVNEMSVVASKVFDALVCLQCLKHFYTMLLKCN